MRNGRSVTISGGNRKLGDIMNVSLVPIECCPRGIPCSKACYALKAYRMYPSTRKAWTTNAWLARNEPEIYFAQIAECIAAAQPRYFRWHVAGDILNLGYLRQMCRIAAENQYTQFLAFTKAFDIVNEYENARKLPCNLSIIFSAWPGMNIDNPHGHRIAWLQDGEENRVTAKAVQCPGQCQTCTLCFGRQNLNRDVVFFKH